MEGPYAQPQPQPRLRLNRQPLPAVADRPDHPHAGPSRPPQNPDVDLNDAVDDYQPTPKGHSNSNASPAEAAARLRALLRDSRVPNESKIQTRAVSPSELDSDFDPPRFSPPPPSEAKASLKDIFSRAVEDTPVKSRRVRRNSTSEVDEIPREGAKSRGKRKSLSDEELEKPYRSSQRSEASFQSSRAATLDSLRERLNNSQTPLKNEAAPTPLYHDSSADNTTDTATFLRDLNSSRATPPAATSTPPHSMEMSANSKYQSNLMDHDSEMQHMMKDLDSYEGDSGPNHPVSFPSSRGKPTRPGTSHAHSSTSQSHRLSYNGTRPVSQMSSNSGTDGQHDQPEHLHDLEAGWNKPKGPARQHSHGLDHSRSHSPSVAVNGHKHVRTLSSGHGVEGGHGSRPVSQMSSNSGTDSQHDQPEHLHELEAGWNKPHPKGPARQHSHGLDHSRSHSPSVAVNGHARVRTRSGDSMHSMEGNGSSKGNSVSSHSDYKERMLEHEKDRNAEREHAWNRPQAARSTSTLSVHSPVDRSRKLSHPSRPGSSLSHLPPAISRRQSSSSSRHSSDEEEEEVQHEIEHERERNWNAPIQRWGEHPHGHHSHHARPKSPMPPSSSASTPSNVRSVDRVRAESLRTRGTPKGDSPVHHNESPRPIASSSKTSAHETPASHQARPKTLLGSNTRPRPMSYPARPNSPLPPPLPPSEAKSKSKPALSTSAASTHKLTPQPRSPERERGHSRIPSSPSPSPGHRPASRTSISHIPVRTPGKTQSKTSNGHTLNGRSAIAATQNSNAASLQQAVHVPIIPEPEPESADEGQNGDPFTETDDGDHAEDRTPTVDIIVAPPPERPRLPTPPSPEPVVTSEEEIFQKALTTAPPPSPPPSPPTPTITAPPLPQVPPTTILGLLSTPPKRPSLHSSRLEFQTPSPPKGLPDLPGPPSSDEDTETDRPIATPLRFNGAADLTSTKTPRPPGAWASTPAPVARSNSLPAPEHDESDSQYEGGLATPVASLSRASTLPAQTPKPPGGWVATPTPRKSILKVRFNEPAELELSATEDFSSTNGHPEESSATDLATPVDEKESVRVSTPELPTTPVSPSKSPRRSPTIRVVDEYGRPDKSKPAKSPKNRNKNPVRIVDAMGREVETVEQTIKTEVSDDVPLNHNEALRVVREGVADLAQKLEQMDISSDFVLLDEDRLRELDNASRAAREARDDLKQAYQNDRTAQLRASMQRSKSHSQAREIESRSPSPRIWLWTFIILSQALFIFLIYRIQKRSARELFLTTYYDPFYPDLHLYRIKFDYISFPRTPPSITSLSSTLRQEGFKAFVSHLVDMIVILFADWRVDTWRRWGADDMQSVRWPPT